MIRSVNGSPKVMVRMLTRGSPRLPAIQRMAWIKDHRPDWNSAWHFNKYSVAMARCEIVVEARRVLPDYLIMLDDDVDPPGLPFLDLVNLDVPIVAGAVLTFQSGCVFWNAYNLTPGGIFYSLPAMLPRVMEVYAVGTAALCLRQDVYTDLALDPLFEFTVNADGSGTPLGGEDITFCRKAQEKGIPIHVDGRVQAEHQTMCDLLMWMEKTRQMDVSKRPPSTMVINTHRAGVTLPAAAYLARTRAKATAEELEALKNFEEAAFAV